MRAMFLTDISQDSIYVMKGNKKDGGRDGCGKERTPGKEQQTVSRSGGIAGGHKSLETSAESNRETMMALPGH